MVPAGARGAGCHLQQDRALQPLGRGVRRVSGQRELSFCRGDVLNAVLVWGTLGVTHRLMAGWALSGQWDNGGLLRWRDGFGRQRKGN